ncbi:Hypothetical predicted protein [Mytilus galloprovincialis]|uniref:Integrase p58-like C-terminal domain-containing protein n=1 Tax=Mytilus galloprovincialis TaxID=29158 RepID=A0A8B6CXC4_MYTGA|nr:Hypothetical predicted protein [Mytilus galloprovincialis]
MLMFGREVQHPVDLLMGTSHARGNNKQPSEFIRDLKQVMEEVHSIVRENIQSAQFRQKRDYDTKLFQRTYDVGDAVYRIDSATKVGESKKLRSPWQGPYLVIKVISPVLYRIQKRKKALVVHHDKLKPCEDRVLPKWLKYTKHRLS